MDQEGRGGEGRGGEGRGDERVKKGEGRMGKEWERVERNSNAIIHVHVY